jgi:hypothetical protein
MKSTVSPKALLQSTDIFLLKNSSNSRRSRSLVFAKAFTRSSNNEERFAYYFLITFRYSQFLRYNDLILLCPLYTTKKPLSNTRR